MPRSPALLCAALQYPAFTRKGRFQDEQPVAAIRK
jgi:hypothetical protein